MSDLNDLNKPVTTDTEPNVLDTLRGHITRAITWTGYTSTANKVAGLMSAVTAAVSGGRSLRLYRRNDANTADEEVVSLPGISVGGNAGTASAAQAGSALETALAAKAPLVSPAFTGTPTVPTAAAGTNTTQAASTAFVTTAVANVINTAPAALDTLNELATALGNDPNFATSMNTALANRVVKTSANRPGVTKLYRADSDDAYNAQLTWQTDKTGHWSLRGYSADTYHAPVYVAFAGAAATAAACTGNAATATTAAACSGNAATATTAAACTGNAATATTATTANNLSPGVAASNLGYMPVQQGTGINQGWNAVKIGWGTGQNSGYIGLTVDVTDLGVLWHGQKPISTFTGTGYQRLPSGLIIQWGSFSANASFGGQVTLPITFPNTGLTCSRVFNQVSGMVPVLGFVNNSTLQFQASSFYSSDNYGTHYWFAIGY